MFNSLSIYQVFVSSFQDGDSSVGHGKGYGPSDHNGDLQGIINALSYIKDLGFNAIWMTPIFDSTGTKQSGQYYDTQLASTGYYPTDCFNIDPHVGTNDKFKELVTTAHAKGLYVILDGVFGHNGGMIKASPNGKWPSIDQYYNALYPDSLDYYKEVAQYWITNYEIDGWRLDMAKELIQNGHNYLNDLREAVYEVCDQRISEGKVWGVLGYMVAEFWDGLSEINNGVYKDGALKSAFEFPFRYNLVQALAQDENGASVSDLLGALKDIHRTPMEKSYTRNDIYPNLFIDNHDTYRFGNLIRMKHNIGVDNDNYWRFHKIAIGTLATYSGPITLYYGDEIGTITDCWYGSVSTSTCPVSEYPHEIRTDSGSSARTTGQISNFNERQTDLHDFTKGILKARLVHPSMYRGTNGKTSNENVYFNCKYDPLTGDKVVFVVNCNSYEKTIGYEVGGVKLYDFASHEVIYGESGKYSIYLEPYGARVFQVYDEDVEISTEVSEVNCDALYAESASQAKKSNDKKLIAVIAVAAVVVIIVIVVAIIVVRQMKKKYMKMAEDNHCNPLSELE